MKDHHKLDDGSVIRDSQETSAEVRRKKPRGSRPKRPAEKVAPIQVTKSVEHTPEDWLVAWQRICSKGIASSVSRRPSKSSVVSSALAGITARQEEAFQAWWRESRSQCLRPRDSAAPTAAQRIEALKLRVLSRSSCSSSASGLTF